MTYSEAIPNTNQQWTVHMLSLYVILALLSASSSAFPTLPCNLYTYYYSSATADITTPADFCVESQYSADELYYCSEGELYLRHYPSASGCSGTYWDTIACNEYGKLNGECQSACDKSTCAEFVVQYYVYGATSCDDGYQNSAKRTSAINIAGYCYPAGFSDQFNMFSCDTANGTYTISKYDNANCEGAAYETYETPLGYSCNPNSNPTGPVFAFGYECAQGNSQPFPSASGGSTPAPSWLCSPTESTLSCDWYEDCLESFKTCGASGYALGYGYKYCSLYEENMAQFTSNGQQWVNNVKLCLQLELALIMQSDADALSCDEIKSIAFRSHPACYTGQVGGISVCDLTPREWWSIVKIVNVGLVYPDPFDSVPQMLEVMAQCGFHLTYQFTLKLAIESGHTFDAVVDAVQDTASSVWGWATGVVQDLLRVNETQNALGFVVQSVSAGSVEVAFTVVMQINNEQTMNITRVLPERMERVKGQQVHIGNSSNSIVLSAVSLTYDTSEKNTRSSDSSAIRWIIGVLFVSLAVTAFLCAVTAFLYRKKQRQTSTQLQN